MPVPGPGDVLVELEASGICGTDVGLAYGYLGKPDRILGHEGVGRIVEIGSTCQEALQGQRVGVGWLRDACGSCYICMRGDESRCQLQTYSGRDVSGTLSRYTIVPERYVTVLPEGLPAQILAPIMCAGVTAYKALKCSEAVPGSWVAISGAAGGVGALALQYAKAMGYRPIAIDGGEAHRQACLELGAELYIDFQQHDDLKEAILKETKGELCSSAIVCAGAAPAYEAALTLLEHAGTLVAVGIPPPTSKVSFHPLTLIDKGIKLVGSVTGTRSDVAEAVKFVQRGLVVPKTVTIRPHELNGHIKEVGNVSSKLIVDLAKL